jgi:hypothetical protein
MAVILLRGMTGPAVPANVVVVVNAKSAANSRHELIGTFQKIDKEICTQQCVVAQRLWSGGGADAQRSKGRSALHLAHLADRGGGGSDRQNPADRDNAVGA